MRWTVFEFQTWEMTYLFPTLFGAGVMLCSQFVGVSVAAPEEHEATSFTTFYFSQQIGFMTGTSVTGSLFRVIFEARLKDFSESDSVSIKGKGFASKELRHR